MFFFAIFAIIRYLCLVICLESQKHYPIKGKILPLIYLSMKLEVLNTEVVHPGRLDHLVLSYD